MLNPPYPGIAELLYAMGQAGRHLSDVGACEGAAGNISICLRWQMEPRSHFPLISEIEMPLEVPGLGGATFLVTGSGRRLREILDDPAANIACIVVEKGGRIGKVYTALNRRFEKPSSEFNSHLAVHYDQVKASGTNFHALIHAQPVNLTYLSHIPRYRDEHFLNTRLLRWQPETILNLPEGIGCVPFCVPGSGELMAATVESLRAHRLVIWSKHGVMARSDQSVMHAADRVEYAETAARYEQMNLAAGEPAEGLTPDEIRRICSAHGIRQDFF